MKNNLKKISGFTAALAIAFTAFGAQAATYNVQPGVYDPDNTGTAVSFIDTSGALHLQKNAPTPTNSAALADITGVSGLSTTGLTLGFQVDGYCGAGAPRYNVELTNGDTIFLGCIYGNDGSGNVTFTAGNTYGGVLFPEGQTVQAIQLVQDEEGQTTLTNITVNGMTVTAAPGTLKDQCKKGGYEALGYRNQGQCVSAFASSNK